MYAEYGIQVSISCGGAADANAAPHHQSVIDGELFG
jgi:hypothetical protein